MNLYRVPLQTSSTTGGAQNQIVNSTQNVDIKSMYSNIIIEEGIEAFEEALEKRCNERKKALPTSFLIELLGYVLKSNVFEFNGEYCLQIIGTAMGTRVAPTFANIYMDINEMTGKVGKIASKTVPFVHIHYQTLNRSSD